MWDSSYSWFKDVTQLRGRRPHVATTLYGQDRWSIILYTQLQIAINAKKIIRHDIKNISLIVL